MRIQTVERNYKTLALISTILILIALFTNACGAGGNATNLDGKSNTTAAATLAPTGVSIGNQAVGTASGSKSVTLSNTGDADLSISSFEFSGSNPGDFSQTNDCGATVASGDSCTIKVTFKPAAAGTRAADLSVNRNSNAKTHFSGTGIAPAVTLAPTSLSFTSQAVNVSTAAQNITLTNSGTAVLTLSTISVSGTNAGDFSETDTCGATLAADASCMISVKFKPSTAGTRTSEISIADNAAGSPQSVALTGTLSTSTASASPTSLTFSSQSVGTTSAAQTITLNNTGSATMNVSAIVVLGSNAGDFAETDTCGATLNASASCSISVAFKPSAGGARTATVSISDTATGSPQTVSLSGMGAAAAASVSPSSVAYGNLPVTSGSTARAVTLSNTGTAALSVSSIAVSGTNAGDFTQTNNCGSSVAAGGGCAINVTFNPSASGARTATLVIANSASPTPHSITLSGTGTAAGINLSKSSLTFGNQSLGVATSAQSVTVSNPGNATLSITGIALSGSNAGDFIQSNNCGSSVAAGASCTVSVTFKPTAGGARTASISVSNSAAAPQTVSLSGTGATAGISVSPSSLTFGSQAVNKTSSSQSVTLTNSGNASLTVSSISISGANSGDFDQSNTCGSRVASGSSCTVSVTFTPSASGSRSATMNIANSVSPQSVSLTGSGAAAGINVSPSSITFGSQALNKTSAAQSVTLSNTGNAALSVSGVSISGASAGDFDQSNTCGSSVAAGSSCTVSVTFTPSASGNRSATVNIANSVSAQTVSLTGTGAGTSSGLSISSSSLNFPGVPLGQSSPAETVTATNNGSSAVTIASIAITGTNAGDFAQNSNCGNSLAAGANCTIVLLFTPSVLGPRTASLSISDSSSTTPQTVSLTGAGGHDVVLTWTASPTDGIVGYNIYRGTSVGGESKTPLNANPINGTDYTDENVTAGTQYYYVVTSVTSDGETQSAPSPEANATVPTP